jgi:dipeptidyl aminopeptidase/acylaminoacyl peptidase
MRNVLCGSVISLMLMGACKQEAPLDKPVKITEILDAEYGPDPRNKLDIYLPEVHTKETKVIVFVQGNQFFSGDKSKFTDLAKFFRDKGYATATINFRVKNVDEQSIQTLQVNDLGRAIDYISSRANELNISSNNFGVLGTSAGAYISLLYTYKFNIENKVKAVVSMGGPTNLAELINEGSKLPAIDWYIGCSIQNNPALYKNESPVFNVKSSTKPTLLFHGKLDQIVPEDQAIQLKSRLDAFNVKSKLVIFEDTGHEVLNLDHTASFLADVDLWFKENIK